MTNPFKKLIHKLHYIIIYCQLRDLNLNKQDAQTLAHIIQNKAWKDH